MNRLLTLCRLTVLALCWPAVLAAANDGVTVDSMWTEGRLMACYDFEVHLLVTNHGAEALADGSDFFEIVTLADHEGKEVFRPMGNVWAAVAAGETRELVIPANIFHPGTYQLFVTQEVSDLLDITRDKLLPVSVTIDVTAYRKPALRAEYEVNMSTMADSLNVVYGNRVSGRLLLINDDDQAFTGYYNFAGLNGFDLLLVTDLDNSAQITRVAQLKIAETIAAHDTIVRDFCFDVDMKYGQRYNLGVLWSTAHGMISQVGIYDFESRSGLATYWTSRKEVKPLPMRGDSKYRSLPYEAVAVDLRGLYKVNNVIASIDTKGANPNCIYYLDFMDNLPAGIPASANIVRDYEAKKLTVSADHAYYCPMPFEASLAEFSCRPEAPANAVIHDGSGREILFRPVVLPFSAKQAWYPDVNDGAGADVLPYRPEVGFYRFVGDANGVLDFRPVPSGHLCAYEPYMMWTLPLPVVLHADDTTVPATRPALVHGTDFDFVGVTTELVPSLSTYRWSSYDMTFVQMATDDLERPFMPCMQYVGGTEDATPAMPGFLLIRGISELSHDGTWEQSTSVASPGSGVAVGAQPVYTLSGQRVGTAGRDGLRPGIYIIGGRKTVVR